VEFIIDRAHLKIIMYTHRVAAAGNDLFTLKKKRIYMYFLYFKLCLFFRGTFTVKFLSRIKPKSDSNYAFICTYLNYPRTKKVLL